MENEQETVRDFLTDLAYLVLKTLDSIEIETKAGRPLKLSEKAICFGQMMLCVGQDYGAGLNMDDEKEVAQ